MAFTFICNFKDDTLPFCSWSSKRKHCGLYYLHDMKKLPSPISNKFIQGGHVARHHEGLWNGTWTNMYLETTFIRYGNGQGGLIGLTLKPKVVKNWSYGLKACIGIIEDLEQTRRRIPENYQLVHKEEGQGITNKDSHDRCNVQKKN